MVKARGVLEVFLVLLLAWNLAFHTSVDLSCPFNWAFLAFSGVVFCVKAKNITSSTSLRVYQNYFIPTKLLWYQAKV